MLGAFDPLEAIADVCQHHGLWLHVDVSWDGPKNGVGWPRPRPILLLPLHRLPGVEASCCHRHIDISWLGSRGAYGPHTLTCTLQILDPENTLGPGSSDGNRGRRLVGGKWER